MVKTNKIIALVVFLIILCAVLAVCLLYKSNVEITKQSRSYPDKTLIYDEYSFRNDSLVYLVCDKPVNSKCKLVQEKYPFKNSPKSCNVSLDVEGDIGEKSIFVVAFGTNRAILFWTDDNSRFGSRSFTRFSVVDIDNCTQEYTKYHYGFTTEQLDGTNKVLAYTHTFDIFFRNASLCPYTDCRDQYNRHGNKVNYQGNPIANGLFNINKIYAISEGAPYAYLFLKNENKQSRIYMTRPNDSQKILITLPEDIKISIIDESIGICSRLDINTKCYQYNSTGHLQMSVNLTDVNNVTDLHSIYTLPKGGFLLNFIDFGRCQEEVCDESLLSNFFIQKIDASGKEIGKLRVQGLEKDNKGVKHSHIWKKNPKKEEYCVFIVPRSKQSDKIDMLVNCFPISNFTD